MMNLPSAEFIVEGRSAKRRLSSWLLLGCSSFFLLACQSFQSVNAHDRVLLGMSAGALAGAALYATQPFLGLLTGAGLGGSVVSIHELSNCNLQAQPHSGLVAEVKKGVRLDHGVGQVNIPDGPNSGKKLRWSLYQSGFWIKNKGNQFLFVDKVMEFEPVAEDSP